MSFEDLQKKWGNQFPERGQAPDAKVETALLRQIRRDEQRFRYAVLLLALSDAVAFALLSWIIVVSVKQGELFPREIREHRLIVVVGAALWVALIGAATKLRTHLAPASAEGPAALPASVRRDGRRFQAMVLWQDLRELATGMVIIFMAVFQALQATRYAALDWTAAVLLAVSLVVFLALRIKTRARWAPADDTVMGTLTRSIDRVQGQVRLLENQGWVVAPAILGGILAGPIHGAATRGGMKPAAVVGVVAFAAAGWIVWRLNRQVARNRLRPRLEQLERLQSELSLDSSLHQP